MDALSKNNRAKICSYILKFPHLFIPPLPCSVSPTDLTHIQTDTKRVYGEFSKKKSLGGQREAR